MSGSALLRRVAARAGVGIWQHRGGVLFALAAVAAISGYVAFAQPGPGAAAPLGAGVGSNDGDCADTAIAAITDKSDSTAQRAYQCMAPTFQQRVPEQTFVQQLESQAPQNVSNVSRVGDYRTASGSMVYYAVDANGESVGYIVYLGGDGKVQKIQ